MVVETQAYRDFSLGIHNRVVNHRVPADGTIEVTHRCPLRCVHCYNNLPIGGGKARNDELTYPEHCRILDEITEAGCLWLLFTGGEVFVRSDFLDIYTYAKQKGLLITLFTNGILIDERIANFLADWRPFSIEITLYGRTEETHEQITGLPGSYDRCMRAVSLLMERGLPLGLKTAVVTINKHEIWDIKRFVEEDLGLSFRFDAMINPRIDCSKRPLAVRFTPLEVVDLDIQDQGRRAEWLALWNRLTGSEASHHGCDQLYTCGGGLSGFAINPYGKLSPCVLSRHAPWDLRKGSFREGWESSLLSLRQRRIAKLTKCVRCELKAMCEMCPANGELEQKNPEEPVDFLCQVAHLRAYVLGIPIPPHGECEYCAGGARYGDMARSVEALQGKILGEKG